MPLWFHIFSWIVAFFAFIGVELNIKKNKFCFVIWTFTNASWCAVDFYMGIYAQSALFFVFFLQALKGLYRWHQDDKTLDPPLDEEEKDIGVRVSDR